MLPKIIFYAIIIYSMKLKEPSLYDRTLDGIIRASSAVAPGERCALDGLVGSSKAYLLSKLFVAGDKAHLAVLPTGEEAEELVSDLKFFLGDGVVFFLPEREQLTVEASVEDPEITAARLAHLHRLTRREKIITVTSAGNLSLLTISQDKLKESAFSVEFAGEYQRDELLLKLTNAGYRRMEMVEDRGEVSVRGAIIDIFPTGEELPLRIEFFGDEVESIRSFDPLTQRKVGERESALILPAREAVVTDDTRAGALDRLLLRADELECERKSFESLLNAVRLGSDMEAALSLLPIIEAHLESLFDYLKEDTLISIIEPDRVQRELNSLMEGLQASAERLSGEGGFYLEPESVCIGEREIATGLAGFPVLELRGSITAGAGEGEEDGEEGGLNLGALLNTELRQDLATVRGSGKGAKGEEFFTPLAKRISTWLKGDFRVFLTAHNAGQAERTIELLEGYGIGASIRSAEEVLANAAHSAGGVGIVTGSLSSGFRLPASGLAIVSEEDIFGKRHKRRAPGRGRLESFLARLEDLSDGEAIVHRVHGIATYRGLKRIEVDSIENEFLVLEYKDSDKLYLPVENMDSVTKYHGVEGRAFDVDKLGGTGWTKKTGKARKAVEKIAAELLKLYAEREAIDGYAFSGPSHIFDEFAASFEYEETPDQARAIDDTLSDMEGVRPMDRLICGDVGYGKTEVAMRAAFKAVLDGKQVAVLVPTTILAQQHFMTFTERFAPYPCEVDLLSRFRSAKQQKETIGKLVSGEVDIVIGTHRILGRDVAFKDLGLVIIDEEHRFGVKQKERLREIRKQVDLLTLTATPIPRTLQMSIADVRGLSIISTPPEDRRAIKTVVTGFNEKLIKDAIVREVKRGGQVFFVHNRISSIGAIAEFIERLVPGVRLVVAHGQMGEHELEKKMFGFIEHEYDILLSTTIIESGLDIPSANTIIINRADRFGLAELYQLRGRVGRSSHRAYAYLIAPNDLLSSGAHKRLEAIAALTEPGAGFRVASHDLEIRGAGELLGTSQSGRIAEVGFEMYVTLLEEAVAELKGEPIVNDPPPEVTLRVSRYIPEEYIPDTRQRLGLYKSLSEAGSEEELYDICDELEDRYGKLPGLVTNLIRTAEVRILLKRAGGVELKQLGRRLYIRFHHAGDAAFNEETFGNVMALVRDSPERFRLSPDSKLVCMLGEEDSPEGGEGVIREAIILLKGLLKK